MFVNLKLDGVEEITARVDLLSRALRTKILRKALRPGGNVLKKGVAGRIATGPGNKDGAHLNTSIVVIVQTGSEKGNVIAFVTTMHRLGQHAGLVEHGHKPVTAGTAQKGGKDKIIVATGKKALRIRLPDGSIIYRYSTRGAEPHPAWAPAAASSGPAVKAAIAAKVQEELAITLSALGKRK